MTTQTEESQKSPGVASSVKGSTPSSQSFSSSLLLFITHILCLFIYLYPLHAHPYGKTEPGVGGAVLDELHIVSKDNKDVFGSSTIEEVFTNDYWGRPMNSPSSHKSWRPLTILSFRFLKGPFEYYQLEAHRFFNVVTHAATAECVSILAVQLFGGIAVGGTDNQWKQPSVLLLRILTKLLFALHPTHVEVTANAANRPHLLAVLLAVVLCDPRLHILLVMLLQIAGLLCSETFIFTMPAVVTTLLLIQYRRQREQQMQAGSDWKEKKFTALLEAFGAMLPRFLSLFLLSVGYLFLRWMMDWLSIPEGLIRPAENPFFPLSGVERFRNYIYIVSIHVGKSWFVDFAGFSHEYGFECIRQVQDWGDPRLAVVYGMALALLYSIHRAYQRNGLEGLFDIVLCLSWMVTLFPISGVVKVGTFVADRITVASTVASCILTARYVSLWLTNTARGKWYYRYLKIIVVASGLVYLYARTHRRALDWMDSVPLLESSLKTCPRSAKSHLEMSKVYSGLVSEKFDLEQSLYHLDKVEEIDPTYCDVHQQYAHVYIQQQRLLEFEERLTKAILCPFSMGGATELWRRYWPMVTKDPNTGAEAKMRMNKYTLQIEAAVAREQAGETELQPGGGYGTDEL